MTKTQLQAEIIAKQDELDNVRVKQIIFIAEYNSDGKAYNGLQHESLCTKVQKLTTEIKDLKQQLAESNDHQIRMPQINDYPSTDERSYINLDNTGSVNWEKYAKALIAYIKQLEDCVVAEIKTTPIPSGWICPRCQKVHSWMVQSCDCPPNVITASTTIIRDESPIKELAEIRGKTCDSCKYGTGYYRCVTCDHYEKWEPIK